MEREIVESEIDQAVHQIWSSIFSLEILPAEADGRAEPAKVESASVSISGEWNGDLFAFADRDLLELLTRSLFQFPAGSPVPEGLADDTLREVANIIAGNLKVALPEPCRLSVPSTLDTKAQDYSVNNTLTALSYRCCDKPFWVVLSKRAVN